MEISDVRVRLVKDSKERLKAVCSVTLDSEFVVRDVKVVEGTNGLFVAMPSRKLSVPCSRCRAQNHLRARYCNECGQKLPPARIPTDADGREKAHRDIAHPITTPFRQTIQGQVLDAYQAECEYADETDSQAAGESGRPYGGDEDRGGEASADAGSGQRQRRRGRRRPRGDEPERGPEAEEKAPEAAALASPGTDAPVSEVPEPAVFEPAASEPEVAQSDPAGEVAWAAPVDQPTTEESEPPPSADREEAPADQVESSAAVDEPSRADDENPEEDLPFGAGLL